jgi:hypothetical protein
MTEYHFTVPSSAPVGRAVFRVWNAGRRDHNLTLEKLPSDFPPINVQLHSSTRRGAPAIALMPITHPGQSDTFAVDLTPGRYAILSSVVGRDGVVDALEGMNAEIRVRPLVRAPNELAWVACARYMPCALILDSFWV